MSCFRAIFVVSLLALTGCATYEYDIVQPPGVRRHIGHDQDTVIASPPVEYRMRAVEDRLVVRMFNRSNQGLRLVPEQSSVVDPSGQAHPVRGAHLPPGSYTKLVLPPVPHWVPTSPRYGFGMGYGTGFYRGPLLDDEWGYYEPWWDEPQYMAVYEPGESPWNWPADSDVRLVLTFQRGNEGPFTQEWTIRKRRM
jgi:hypothetical protein